MAAEKSPAFQFYPKEFLTDGNVAGMSLQERGAYITLLCICWQDQSLPVETDRLANMVGTPHKAFVKFWPAVRQCFEERDGRLVHTRLEKEREKQAAYRRRQSDKAASRWAKPGESPADAAALPDPMPESCSPISDLRSPIKHVQQQIAREGSKRPIFKGQRFVVFEWQLEGLQRLLGTHLDAFDLHAWFFTLDSRAMATKELVPQRDNGAWLLAQTEAEAARRGLVMATTLKLGKQTTRLASALANIKAEARS